LWFNFRIARDSRDRGSVELVRSSNECIGDFESTEEAFCCPDFGVTTWALASIIVPPFAKLIRGCWFATVVVMSEGPEAGLTHIDAVLEQGELANYYLAHSARADMYRRLGRTAEARSSYEKALALTQQEPERQFLQERIRQLK
jgi:hypothetical protein